MDEKIGRYAFVGGLAFSVILGMAELPSVAWITAVLAIIVALINIQTKETMKMILWTIGMGVFGFGALASNFAAIPLIGETLGAILTNIGIFFMTIAGVFLLKVGYKILSK